MVATRVNGTIQYHTRRPPYAGDSALDGYTPQKLLGQGNST